MRPPRWSQASFLFSVLGSKKLRGEKEKALECCYKFHVEVWSRNSVLRQLDAELPVEEVLVWQRTAHQPCPGARRAGLHTGPGRASACGHWVWWGKRPWAGRGSVCDGETPDPGEGGSGPPWAAHPTRGLGFDPRLCLSLLGTYSRTQGSPRLSLHLRKRVPFSWSRCQLHVPSHCLLRARQATLDNSAATLGFSFLICKTGVILVSPDNR